MSLKTLSSVPVDPSQQSGLHRFSSWLVLAYWGFFLIIHVFTDCFLDLHTFTDCGKLALFSGLAVLPLALYTLVLIVPHLEWPWYGNVFISLALLGFYILSAYFTVKKLDLLWSIATRPAIEQQWPILRVEQVFARRGGFIHTRVMLRINQKPVELETSRSSYFLLKNRSLIAGKISISALNEYIVRDLNVSASERWQARKAYGQDWFQRYWWLGVLIVLYLIWQWIKSRLFPKTA